MLRLLVLACLCVPFGTPVLAGQKVVVVLLDDIGVERVALYGKADSNAPTPTLDRLAAEGVLFENAWAYPLCAPARAALLTGRHAFRTGMGTNPSGGKAGLPLAEWTIAEVLSGATDDALESYVIGKWHVGHAKQTPAHAQQQGFAHFLGSFGNLGDYDDWQKTVDGITTACEDYATTTTVDDTLHALELLGEAPGFVYVALNAAHPPLHAPPGDLHTQTLEGDPQDSPSAHHRAMVESADHELGRLVAGLPADTTLLVIGDNGSPRVAVDESLDRAHAKGSLYEGGLHVPFVAWGAGVEGRGRCAELVSLVDILPTVGALFGHDARAILPAERVLDGQSLAPLLADPKSELPARVLFAQRFTPNGFGPPGKRNLWAVRGRRYKLLRDEVAGEEELFDLEADPRETVNLLKRDTPLSDEQRRAREHLADAARELLESR